MSYVQIAREFRAERANRLRPPGADTAATRRMVEKQFDRPLTEGEWQRIETVLVVFPGMVTVEPIGPRGAGG